MNFDFEDKDLLNLYVSGTGKAARDFPSQVVDEFFHLMSEVLVAPDERYLRALKGRRFEKLHGGRGEFSMRINSQFRLIFSREETADGPGLLIKRIEDYH